MQATSSLEQELLYKMLWEMKKRVQGLKKVVHTLLQEHKTTSLTVVQDYAKHLGMVAIDSKAASPQHNLCAWSPSPAPAALQAEKLRALPLPTEDLCIENATKVLRVQGNSVQEAPKVLRGRKGGHRQ